MKLLAILFLAITFFACSGDNDDMPSTEISTCMNTEISTFQTEWENCSGSSIKQFTFQEEMVFGFQIGSCLSDAQMIIKDNDCVELCALGGLLGEVNCNDVDFFATAVQDSVIWEN